MIKSSLRAITGNMLLLLLLLVACQMLLSEAPATATPQATATRTPRLTATSSPVPPTATPTLTPTPGPLSPSAIFDRASPSIAYIETPFGSGSGILLEGGYLVTNAHVIWPYDQARVAFPDGSEFEAVPLINWDQMTDLAVLGPLEGVSAPPLSLVDGEASVVGSDVYLVGYPGEVDSFPQPTITRGLISRKREWDVAGITYLQTDATVSGGQSGGALLSEMGEVIGISGFAFDDAEFGLVASAGDLDDRLARLVAGEDISGLGLRLIDHTAVDRNPTVRLRHAQDAAVFLVAANCGPTLEVEAESENDITLQLLDMRMSDMREVDEGLAGTERFTLSVARDRPYMFAVYQFDEEPGVVGIQSSCGLLAFEDEDDWTSIQVGETVGGAVDYPGDLDLFYLNMGEGELANFLVDSASIDPFIHITYPGASDGDWVEDDMSGGGLFGLNADLTFRAPHGGRFLVTVGDAWGTEVGGYSLSVSHRRSGAPTPVSLPPTPVPVASDYGLMQLYEGVRYPFTMQIPATWDDITPFDESCPGTCFASEDGFLVVVEEDVAALMGQAGRPLTPASNSIYF